MWSAPRSISARILIAMAAIVCWSSPAAAATVKVEELRADINYDWMITAAALVLLMQIGFMLLEAGASRSKNSINVAQKNLADFALSIACFGVIGFMVMFGASQGGWFGLDGGFVLLSALDDGGIVFFVFQAMFVGTAATIMSGAVAERFCFKAYILTIPVITLLIYPVYGHWAWGNLLQRLAGRSRIRRFRGLHRGARRRRLGRAGRGDRRRAASRTLRRGREGGAHQRP